MHDCGTKPTADSSTFTAQATEESCSTKCNTFLNRPVNCAHFLLTVEHSLGIISRVMLALNRRGLVPDKVNYEVAPAQNTANLSLCLKGDAEQIKLVSNDINKLYDLLQPVVVSHILLDQRITQ